MSRESSHLESSNLDQASSEAALPACRWWLRTGALCVLIVCLTRIPILLGPHLIPDGDEAVLGLMARELASGEGLPLFFSGQRYGLSIIETALAAAAFLLSGPSAVALKAAMLPLFVLGVLLFANAARRLAGDRVGLLVCLLLSIMPAWGGFALKARGGYATGFVLAGLVLSIAAHASRGGRRSGAVPLGLAVGGVLAVQPVWLLPVLPFAALRALSMSWAERVRGGVCALLPPLLSLGAAALLGVEGLDWSPSLANRELGPRLLLEWPRDLWEASTGAFYLREVATDGVLAVTAFAWALAVVLALLSTGPRLGRAGRVSDRESELGSGVPAVPRGAQRALAIGVLGATLIALPTDTPRYLLPGLSVACLLIGLRLGPALERMSGVAMAALAALVMSAIPALVGQRSLPLAGRVEAQVASESAALDELIEALRERGIAHVFCEHNLLQWILTFESEEELVARWRPAIDRVPEYPRAVLRALNDGLPTAWVGYRDQLEGVRAHYRDAGLEAPAEVGWGGEGEGSQRYFWIEGPPEAVLLSAGFELAAQD